MPGNDERKVRKAAALDVDCVCLDCEDAVAVSAKAEARESIVELLAELDFHGSERAVRINSLDTEFWQEDMEVILSGSILPDALVVPKMESSEQMDDLFSFAATVLRGRELAHPIRLITQVESPLGLLNLREICKFDRDSTTESGVFCHDALILGGDDFAAELGATRTPDNEELLYARQACVAHAKAFGLQAIDIVNINFKDLNKLKQESEQGARLGFTGKQVIHPAQIPVVQRAFSPAPEAVERALAILTAHVGHQEAGTGAFVFEDQMIDMPTVNQCKNVLNLAGVAIPEMCAAEDAAAAADAADTDTEN
eukprot:UC1_evm1s392